MRSATLFLLAILTPCAVLGWVSWRKMQDEAKNIQGQRTALYQQTADNAARSTGEFMTGQLRKFGEAVDGLLAMDGPDELRPRYHQTIRGAFPLTAAGLIIETESGRILPQVEPSEVAVTDFVARHAWFFSDELQPLFVEIPVSDLDSPARRLKTSAARGKAAPAEPLNISDALDALSKDAAPSLSPAAPSPAKPQPAPAGAVGGRESATAANAPADPSAKLSPDAGEPLSGAVKPGGGFAGAPPSAPPAAADEEQRSASRVRPAMTSLAKLVAKYEAGIVSQTHGDRLFTLFWYRPAELPAVTFAVALEPDALQAALAAQTSLPAPDGDTCTALLDHREQAVAQWTQGEPCQLDSTAAVTSHEIGAVLPHWRAAVFLRDPSVYNNLASAARWRLGLIVTTASLAAIAGAFFILRDVRRASRDARLKTDFVSNVSHELKTPLTSIRMFSDLLGNNPAAPPEKTKRYADVIAGEAARLTRLINNVLNFSRMEGGNHELQTAEIDLRILTSETVEHMRPQLEKEGFTLDLTMPESPVLVRGDSDALSQVLLNLLSNAGKYGAAPGAEHSIAVSLAEVGGRACVTVSDRGPGVPRGHERRIFEKFHRAHNMLASGTAGSGLGLTIARRLAEAHGGTLEYAPREGGGSEFSVRLTITGAGREPVASGVSPSNESAPLTGTSG